MQQSECYLLCLKCLPDYSLIQHIHSTTVTDQKFMPPGLFQQFLYSFELQEGGDYYKIPQDHPRLKYNGHFTIFASNPPCTPFI